MTGEQQPPPKREDAANGSDGELHRRLLALRWPEPPPGARERGLARLKELLEKPGANP